MRGDQTMIITFRLMGNTRDKRPVRLWDTDDIAYISQQTKDFLPPSHFDAFCIFELQALQASRKHGIDSTEVRRMVRMSTFHRGHLSKDQFIAEMASLKLVTAIDIRNHGESLSEPFLHE
jgi:hypothetical protein